LSVHAVLRGREQAIDLAELGVGTLELGRAAGKNVQAAAIAGPFDLGRPHVRSF
jgi:hypothetical protein